MMEQAQANLEVFAATLLELASQDSTFWSSPAIRGARPNWLPFLSCAGQIVEVGVAEQNLVGIAAGPGGGRQEGFCGFAGVLSHCPIARTDQE